MWVALFWNRAFGICRVALACTLQKGSNSFLLFLFLNLAHFFLYLTLVQDTLADSMNWKLASSYIATLHDKKKLY